MTTVPNTLCKEVKDISFCMDCVSYGHCEAVFMRNVKAMAKSYADLTKRTSEATYKDFNDILKRTKIKKELNKRFGVKKGEHKDE